MKLTITNMAAAMVAILLTTAAACAGNPTPAPDAPTTSILPEEATKLTRQVQELQAENAAIQEELSALRTEIEKQPQGMMTSAPAEESQDQQSPRPRDPYRNICDRSLNVLEKLLEKLDVELCTYVTHEELFRIEKLDITGDLKAGDLDGLVNLKGLSVSTYTKPLPVDVFADLQSLEDLSMNVKTDEPWGLQGMLTGQANLKALQAGGSATSLDKNDFEGLQALEAININHVTSLEEDAFTGLESLEQVELSGTPASKEPGPVPIISIQPAQEQPRRRRVDNQGFHHPGHNAYRIPGATLRADNDHPRPPRRRREPPASKYHFSGERVAVIDTDYIRETCQIGIGEPGLYEQYPEAQIKVVNRRPEAAP